MVSQCIRVRVVIQNRETKEVYPMMEDFVLGDSVTWGGIRKLVTHKYENTEFNVIKIGYKEIESAEFIGGYDL